MHPVTDWLAHTMALCYTSCGALAGMRNNLQLRDTDFHTVYRI